MRYFHEGPDEDKGMKQRSKLSTIRDDLSSKGTTSTQRGCWLIKIETGSGEEGKETVNLMHYSHTHTHRLLITDQLQVSVNPGGCRIRSTLITLCDLCYVNCAHLDPTVLCGFMLVSRQLRTGTDIYMCVCVCVCVCVNEATHTIQMFCLFLT